MYIYIYNNYAYRSPVEKVHGMSDFFFIGPVASKSLCSSFYSHRKNSDIQEYPSIVASSQMIQFCPFRILVCACDESGSRIKLG